MRRSISRTCGLLLAAARAAGARRRARDRREGQLDEHEACVGVAGRRRLDVPEGLQRRRHRLLQAAAEGRCRSATRAPDPARAAPTSPTRWSTSPAPTLRTPPEPPRPTPFLYFPTVVAPITVSYNVSGAHRPEALRRHDRQDLPGHDHHLERRRDQDRQPEGEAAEHHDHGGPPLRWFGHHAELHQLPGEGGARRVDARNRLHRAVAGEHARRERQRRGRPAGEDAPTAPSATSTSPTRWPASSPSHRSRTRPASTSRRPQPRLRLAARGRDGQPGPHLRPDQRVGRSGVPDHLAHLDHGVHEPDRRQEGRGAEGVPDLRPRDGRRTRARSSRRPSTTRRCPRALLAKAKAQLSKIVVPGVVIIGALRCGAGSLRGPVPHRSVNE